MGFADPQRFAAAVECVARPFHGVGCTISHRGDSIRARLRRTPHHRPRRIGGGIGRPAAGARPAAGVGDCVGCARHAAHAGLRDRLGTDAAPEGDADGPIAEQSQSAPPPINAAASGLSRAACDRLEMKSWFPGSSYESLYRLLVALELMDGLVGFRFSGLSFCSR